jgi:hypothetical protein
VQPNVNTHVLGASCALSPAMLTLAIVPRRHFEAEQAHAQVRHRYGLLVEGTAALSPDGWLMFLAGNLFKCYTHSSDILHLSVEDGERFVFLQFCSRLLCSPVALLVCWSARCRGCAC